MSDKPRPLNPGKRAALIRLARPPAKAGGSTHDAGRFAVPIGELRAAGASDADLRWLIKHHYATPLQETTRHGGSEHSFGEVAAMTFPASTYFVLTYGGRVFVESNRLTGAGVIPRGTARRSKKRSAARRVSWQATARELRVDGRIAKWFARRAPAQWSVLEACQAARWRPPVVVQLLSPGGRKTNRRLSEILSDLNDGIDRSLIHFRLNGDGAVTFDLGG